MTIFVDMDGVLADFDSGHEAVFGIRSSIFTDNIDWEAVRTHKDYYLNLPPMPDLELLWSYVERFSPVVLTGIPKSVAEAADNKKAWVAKNLGPDVEVRCCPSHEKYLHAQPGDILIDDWEKYKKRWIKAGGIWITHTSAENTIEELKTHGFV